MKYLVLSCAEFGVLSMLTVVGGCRSDEPPDVPAPSAEPAQSPSAPARVVSPLNSSTADVSAMTDPYVSAIRTIDAIAALSDLSKPALEQVLGVTLTHLSTVAAALLYYEAALPSGPFSRVELRRSNITQPNFALVLLDTRPGVQVLLTAFRDAGRIKLDMLSDVNPNVPPEGTETYSAKANGQTLSYELTVKSHQLRGVSIKR